MKNYLQNFENCHKFNLSENVKKMLDKEDILILSEIGIPTQILSNEFVYFDDITLEDDYLVLGKASNSKTYLVINIKNRFVMGNYDGTIFYYNTNLKKLLLSLFSLEFFSDRLIKREALGGYYENDGPHGGGNYEKYAKILHEMIADIDIKATQTGVWKDLIQEMSIGAI